MKVKYFYAQLFLNTSGKFRGITTAGNLFRDLNCLSLFEIIALKNQIITLILINNQDRHS